MLYGTQLATCSESHTKHTKTLCGQNVKKLLNLTFMVHVCVCMCVYIYQLLHFKNFLFFFVPMIQHKIKT